MDDPVAVALKSCAILGLVIQIGTSLAIPASHPVRSQRLIFELLQLLPVKEHIGLSFGWDTASRYLPRRNDVDASGASGGRTHKVFLPEDFKSSASANSAIAPRDFQL